MLTGLTIENVVLIERLSVSFESGLCALTGETGAGKSILLDALGLALGGRADAGLVRAGADKAQVTAEFFVVSDHPVYAFLRDAGIEADPDSGSLVLRRVLGADGRSRAFINDQPVSVSLLRRAGDALVEIHGQFETQGLMNPETHRDLLDAYGVTEADKAVLAELWEDWQCKLSEVSDFLSRVENARREEAYLREVLEDLDTLDPRSGEEEDLSGVRSLLMRREQVSEALGAAEAGLDTAEEALGSVWRALERVGEGVEEALGAADRTAAELQEVRAAVAGMSADLDGDGRTLEEIDDRLYALRSMARKLGCTVDDLPGRRAEFARDLAAAEGQTGSLEGLEEQARAARAAYIMRANKVGAARRIAAAAMGTAVAEELGPLKMDKARFEVCVEDLDEAFWGRHGTERVVFLVATNPGAAAGPLNKIASGGEAARFLLAVKVVLARAAPVGTLVFDEVDSGIGGATAHAVGARLARLARECQVLVVTHSPQVAARAAHHWIVAKTGEDALRTDVIYLPDAGRRREEIARMLSGSSVTEEARAAAERLLETGT